MVSTSDAELLLRDLVVEVAALRGEVEALGVEIQYARAALDELLTVTKALAGTMP